VGLRGHAILWANCVWASSAPWHQADAADAQAIQDLQAATSKEAAAKATSITTHKTALDSAHVALALGRFAEASDHFTRAVDGRFKDGQASYTSGTISIRHVSQRNASRLPPDGTILTPDM
jgi:hypothetical protein